MIDPQELERTAQAVYDRTMSDRDPWEYGWRWVPWEELDEDDRETYVDIARERLQEREAVHHLVKIMEDAEKRWDDSHPPMSLLPGAIVPMGYLAKAVLKAGYQLPEQEEES